MGLEERKQTLMDIESRWLHEGQNALAEVVRSHPDEQIYAAAFWLFYADYTNFLGPALAANAESSIDVVEEDDGSTWTSRWVPPEWLWDVLDAACDTMKPLYLKLSESLRGAAHSEWDTIIDLHDGAISRVARALTAMIRSREGGFHDLKVPENFVVAVLDDRRPPEEYNRLVRASVDAGILPLLEGILLPE